MSEAPRPIRGSRVPLFEPSRPGLFLRHLCLLCLHGEITCHIPLAALSESLCPQDDRVSELGSEVTGNRGPHLKSLPRLSPFTSLFYGHNVLSSGVLVMSTLVATGPFSGCCPHWMVGGQCPILPNNFLDTTTLFILRGYSHPYI